MSEDQLLNATARLEVLEVLGDAFDSISDMRQASKYYQQFFALAQAVGDENAQANGLFKVGRLYYRLDDRHQDALENYDQALVLYRSSKNRLGEANTLKAIGDVLQFLKQSQEALNRYETAMEIYRQVGDRLGEANTLQAIGDLEKDPKNGLKRFDQAMQIYQEVGDQYSQARILATSFAPAYIKLGRSYQAKEAYEKALQYFEEIDLEAGIEFCKDKLRNLNQLSINPRGPVAPKIGNDRTPRKKKPQFPLWQSALVLLLFGIGWTAMKPHAPAQNGEVRMQK